MRQKFGNLVQSPKNTLDEMLAEHQEEVQDVLLQKKKEFEELNDLSSRTDEEPQAVMPPGLQSPPLLGGTHVSTHHSEPGSRRDSVPNALRSPRMPAVGMFGVASSSPRSPMSPVKKTF